MQTGKSGHKHSLLKRSLFTVTKSRKLEEKATAFSSVRSTSIDCFETHKQLLQRPLIAFTDICLQTTVSPLTPAGCYYICLANMIQACAVCVKIFALQLIYLHSDVIVWLGSHSLLPLLFECAGQVCYYSAISCHIMHSYYVRKLFYYVKKQFYML